MTGEHSTDEVTQDSYYEAVSGLPDIDEMTAITDAMEAVIAAKERFDATLDALVNAFGGADFISDREFSTWTFKADVIRYARNHGVLVEDAVRDLVEAGLRR